MAVLIAGIGTLYGVLFQLPIREYLPYIALGDIVWIYISTAAQEGCGAFTAAENMIRALKLPFMTHVLRTVLKTFIIFLHGAVAYIPFIIILDISPELIWLLAIPGVALVAIMTVPMVMLLSVVSARFRDIQPSVANFMQLAFFLTPIIWKPDMLGVHRWVADINPFYHFIQVVRAPMMGDAPTMLNYAACAIFITLLFALAVPVFVLGRRKISVWV